MESGGTDGGPRNEADAFHDVQIGLKGRLRYIREHHPEGPYTAQQVAVGAGVSHRTITALEAGTGSVSLITLVKITQFLGLGRVAYFLDEQVFDEVNAQLGALTTMRDHHVRKVALRSHESGQAGQPDRAMQLVQQILESAQQLKDLPSSTSDERS